MSTIAERIAALHAQSTDEARKIMKQYADTLHDPQLLKKLENAPKPLTHGHVLNAIVESVLRTRNPGP